MATADYNGAIERFRKHEYPMLEGSCTMILFSPVSLCLYIYLDSTYLDHAGSTLCSKSLMDNFAKEMTSVLYGNPHSGAWPSQLSTSRVDDTRLRLLDFFKADPSEYDLVFVANATAGVKLVVEGMRSLPDGYTYAYHQACHTSLVGAREEAQKSIILDDDQVQAWLSGEDPFDLPSQKSTTLFAYSAQSHMDGKRYPLSWPKTLNENCKNRSSRIFSLLDAASLSATSQLDLGKPEFAADFIVLSLYKIFGFPDLGALIVRRNAECVFDHRKYFGGGTVDMVLSGNEPFHVRKSRSLHERLEDGTLPFHSIIAVDIALTVHANLFGSMQQVSLHTSSLLRQLLDGLARLQHGNGNSVCVIYTSLTEHESLLGTGPLVSFNIKNSQGAWIGLAEFEKLAILRKIHVRTGALCSPGGIANALDLEPWEMRKNLSAGVRCGEDADNLITKPTGVIRASLGAMSTESDVDRFIDFVEEFFVEKLLVETQSNPNPQTSALDNPSTLRVKTITVFPIKSCGGFTIPEGIPWGIRPEGLAWDREWCLIHRGSGQALSQKRYPKMALLRPILDFENNIMRVEYRGGIKGAHQTMVDIPLSTNASLFDSDFRETSSRVCGEEISAQAYISEEINNFFTNALDVPCVLARFPPGGLGSTSRSCKARIQKHQQPEKATKTLPGSFPDIPSPPDSDSEQQPAGKILLANESPILMIHSSSVNALNGEIKRDGSDEVSEAAFRANIVLANAPGQEALPAYSEELWRDIRIGDQNFQLLGACRRCQMVCIDQETGVKKQEPFVTLAKTRRFNGKVFFGAHMQHSPLVESITGSSPTIQVGESVQVDTWRNLK